MTTASPSVSTLTQFITRRLCVSDKLTERSRTTEKHRRCSIAYSSGRIVSLSMFVVDLYVALQVYTASWLSFERSFLPWISRSRRKHYTMYDKECQAKRSLDTCGVTTYRRLFSLTTVPSTEERRKSEEMMYVYRNLRTRLSFTVHSLPISIVELVGFNHETYECSCGVWYGYQKQL